MLRLSRVLALWAVAAVGFPSIAVSSPARHLYVSVRGKPGTIQRFRLVHGVPVAPPDLVYREYDGPIAVGRDGTLYAKRGRWIYAFPFGSTTPSRRILIPRLVIWCSDAGLFGPAAVDSRGFLWVFIDATVSGARGMQPVTTPDRGHLPCYGTVAFAPSAKGRAAPVQTISTGAFGGVALDDAENLYAIAGGDVYGQEYSNALLAPQLIRVFERPLTYPSALTVDGDGDLFVLNTGNPDTIMVYKTRTGGSTPADTIVLQQANYATSLAVDDRLLYVPTAYVSVDVYQAFLNGPQLPVYSLPLRGADSAAVGP
jgi:hypothetical protein